MGLQRPDRTADNDEFSVKNATFWGAFALHHAWALTSHSLPCCSSTFTARLPPKPATFLDAEDALWVPYTDEIGNLQSLKQVSHTGSVFSGICDLSKLIHETLYTLLRPDHPPTSREILIVYTKYLSWYDLLPDVLRLGHTSTPAVLFTHMYYYFAVLLLFRPFVTLSIPGSNILPRDVCFEAANNISALLHSYSALHTLQRIPSFVPTLLFATSIMHLSVNPNLSPHDKTNQGHLLLSFQVASAVERAMADLGKIAACHASDQRALYILEAVAKKENLLIDTQRLLGQQLSDYLFAGSTFGHTSNGLGEDTLSTWDRNLGRFICSSQWLAAGVQELQNPPFWLIKMHDQTCFPSQALIKAAGFASI
ncbi:hypothetical protein BKA67DRAFT_115813 [Truncatella angustata]|uniref:Transcription factor domain-containing protein n=1 Tax=Truncatella angustata TaxID=152316 RepID=A0A9P8RLY7_9PEZI|nr:uncharacterized protein BKA67DRAFT_115813 [Truncatella angustata]KAH6645551.1 hypothetical protein BKA67DRAFT_115813 [Truncatella angustata]